MGYDLQQLSEASNKNTMHTSTASVTTREKTFEFRSLSVRIDANKIKVCVLVEHAP